MCVCVCVYVLVITVNCQWSAWSVGGCSKTCGGGRRTRSRTKFFTEGHGGTCSGQFSRTQSCNNQRCPGMPFQHNNLQCCKFRLIICLNIKIDNVIVDTHLFRLLDHDE